MRSTMPQLSVDAGAATLAGTLTVTLDPGYSPPIGATFDILTAAPVSEESLP